MPYYLILQIITLLYHLYYYTFLFLFLYLYFSNSMVMVYIECTVQGFNFPHIVLFEELREFHKNKINPVFHCTAIGSCFHMRESSFKIIHEGENIQKQILTGIFWKFHFFT